MRLARIHHERVVDPREIEEKSFQFAVAIVQMAKKLENDIPQLPLDNLLEEGTAVGSQVAEAQETSSRRTYLSRLTSARHASKRVQYWLRIVAEACPPSEDSAAELLADAQALHVTLGGLCVKARQALESEAH